MSEAEAEQVYRELARLRGRYDQVRSGGTGGDLAAVPDDFARLAAGLVWGPVDFVSDLPGKNSGATGLGGGGLSSAALAALRGDGARATS